jgi:hypothetical protein
MLTDLTASLQELASWLQSAAVVVPISQLSFVSWLVFAASGSYKRAPVQGR